DTLVSTVIHWLCETTVWLGSSQRLWAWAGWAVLSSASRARPAIGRVFIGKLLNGELGGHGERHVAQLLVALDGKGPRVVGGPLERQAHHFPATHLAGGLDHQLILPGGQCLEGGQRGKIGLVAARRAGGGG